MSRWYESPILGHGKDWKQKAIIWEKKVHTKCVKTVSFKCSRTSHQFLVWIRSLTFYVFSSLFFWKCSERSLCTQVQLPESSWMKMSGLTSSPRHSMRLRPDLSDNRWSWLRMNSLIWNEELPTRSYRGRKQCAIVKQEDQNWNFVGQICRCSRDNGLIVLYVVQRDHNLWEWVNVGRTKSWRQEKYSTLFVRESKDLAAVIKRLFLTLCSPVYRRSRHSQPSKSSFSQYASTEAQGYSWPFPRHPIHLPQLPLRHRQAPVSFWLSSRNPTHLLNRTAS